MGGTNGDGVTETLRTQTVEIVDRSGAVRGRFGLLSTDADGNDQLGLEVCSDDGATRLSVLVDGGGEPVVLIEDHGNARMVGGIARSPSDDDPDDDAMLGGAYIVWCDGEGSPLGGVRCLTDGSIVPITRVPDGDCH